MCRTPNREELRHCIDELLGLNRRIAALYVHPKGCYAKVPEVELWDEARDARTIEHPDTEAADVTHEVRAILAPLFEKPETPT